MWLADLCHFDAAIDNFERAVALKPKFVDAFNNMGNAYRDTGNIAAAIAAYVAALNVNPAYAAAHFNRCSLVDEPETHRLDAIEKN